MAHADWMKEGYARYSARDLSFAIAAGMLPAEALAAG